MKLRSLVGAAAVLCALSAGGSVWAKAQTAGQAQATCSLDGKGEFSLGWVQQSAGVAYRCVATFNSSLKASGAAWIRVETDGTVGNALPR